MPRTLQKIADQPIVVATFEGYFTVDELAAFMPDAAKMQAESDKALYWVMDLRATNTDFGQIMGMLQQQNQPMPGTVANAPNRVFLVGTAQMNRLFQNAMQQPQYGSLTVPIFATLEDAFAAIQVRIKNTST